MIKVEHTKTITTYDDGIVKTTALVTDAELVLVECKAEEGILYIPNWKYEEGKLHILHKGVSFSDAVYKAFKPILISRTEKIEVGDWLYWKEDYPLIQYIRNDGDAIMVARPESVYRSRIKASLFQKIIALPEHFSPQQLQDIVDGKLKDGDKVLVECETFKVNPEWDKPIGSEYSEERIKLNPYITIYNVEEELLTYEQWFKKYQDQLLDIPKELIGNNPKVNPVEERRISFQTDDRHVPIIPLGLVFNIGGVDYFGTVDNKGTNLAVIPTDFKLYPVEEKMLHKRRSD